MLERLQKIIARAGVASRRHAEELIASGHVTVNGRVITELGTKADESRDHIKVSGKLIRPESERVYLLLNKPPEVVSTMSDPEGRRTLRDLLHGVSERVFPVGRLEYHAAGLVFLTNDGDLANKILQSHQLPHGYLVKLKSLLTFAEIEDLTRLTGARLSRIRGKDTPWYEVTLAEASRDSVRNRLFETGHPVEKMKRVRIGNLELESLAPGRHRAVSPAEVAALTRVASGGIAPNAEVSSRVKVREARVRRPFRPKQALGTDQKSGIGMKSHIPRKHGAGLSQSGGRKHNARGKHHAGPKRDDRRQSGSRPKPDKPARPRGRR
jgi:23S rRNA pseudouridine2605 synthase